MASLADLGGGFETRKKDCLSKNNYLAFGRGWMQSIGRGCEYAGVTMNKKPDLMIVLLILFGAGVLLSGVAQSGLL